MIYKDWRRGGRSFRYVPQATAIADFFGSTDSA
jgi:hypothetical protein